MKKSIVLSICLLILSPLFPISTSIESSGKTWYVDDTTPPETFIELNGTTIPENNYSFIGSVKINITANDDYGMGCIHYIFDGREWVVEGEVATFISWLTGPHNLEFWGVDAAGNEEIPHNFVEFIIYTHCAPRIEIIYPTPGLYIFGNKLLDLSKIFIIGTFWIGASGLFSNEGIESIEFYLDDKLVAKDIEAPFCCYCDFKHFGKGTIKAIGNDTLDHQWEDTLDVWYFNFL